MDGLGFIDRYQTQRQLAWPHIEGFFRQLPENLQELGWGSCQRLARSTSPTTQFVDALSHPAAARVVYPPLWLIDSYLQRGITIERVDDLQTCLFTTSFLGFCAIRIHDDLVDEDRPDTPIDELLLANLLTTEATRSLQRLYPSDSPLWDHHARHWREYTSAVFRDKQRDRGGLQVYSADDVGAAGNKAALLKTGCIAAALSAGQGDQIRQIEMAVDALNAAMQIDNDIHSISDDLANGHFTLPLCRAALAAGHNLASKPQPNQMAAALLASPAVADSHADARQAYGQALVTSHDLGIADLSQFIDWHLADLERSQDVWRLRTTNEVPSFFSKFVTATPLRETRSDLQAAVSMAIQFLEADPEGRESWEIQRSGVMGPAPLVGDLFSRSMLVESLAQLGPARETADAVKR